MLSSHCVRKLDQRDASDIAQRCLPLLLSLLSTPQAVGGITSGLAGRQTDGRVRLTDQLTGRLTGGRRAGWILAGVLAIELTDGRFVVHAYCSITAAARPVMQAYALRPF